MNYRVDHLVALFIAALLFPSHSFAAIQVDSETNIYRTYKNNDELLTLHVTRVITKELTLQAGIKDAQEAFALQSVLLTGALKEKGI